MPRSRHSRLRKLRRKGRRRGGAVTAPSPSRLGVAHPFDAAKAYEAARTGGQRDPACSGCALDAAIDVVHEFLDGETSNESFQEYFEAILRYANLLSKLGTDEPSVLEFIVPRLPFDLVTQDHRRTPAEDFLLRWGTSLPPEGVRAIKALLQGEDEFVEVTKKEDRPALRRLRATANRVWRHALPLPQGTVLLGRLLEMRGEFHLFTAEVFPHLTRSTWRTAEPQTALFRGPMRQALGVPFRSPAKDLHLISLAQRTFIEELAKGEKRSRRGVRKKSAGQARRG